MSTTGDLYPKHNDEYATKNYWEWRYQQYDLEILTPQNRDKGSYDWFQGSYGEMKDLVISLITPGSRVLQLGCGNSKLSEDIYRAFDGDVDLVNIDFSETVIENMKQMTQDLRMEWTVMDIMNMTYPDSSFDVIIDKGTMDALMGDAWVISDEIKDKCDKELSHVSRMLKPGALFIYLTFGQPHFRKRVLLLEKYSWDLELKTVGNFFHYYVYLLRKRDPNVLTPKLEETVSRDQ